MSIAKDAMRFCKLFEGELLLELMLRYWEHPLADDEPFRQQLVEDAHEALRQSVEGTVLLVDMKPSEMNFVSAVWYVEWSYVTSATNSDPDGRRQAWLERVRRAVPSCFCSQNDLT